MSMAAAAGSCGGPPPMSSGERTPVVVDVVRTPIGRAHKGALAGYRPDDLAGEIVRALLERNPGAEGIGFDDLVCGCAFPWGEQGYNLGRCVSILGGLGHEVPGQTITRLCASSLQALRAASHAIQVGEGDAFIVVGVESVSRVGRGRELSELNPLLDPDSDGETLGEVFLPMGLTAENVAARCDVGREAMDRFAQRSHERAIAAQDAGAMESEITPIRVDGKRLERDEGPRRESSLERLAELSPAFKPDGVVTAGNSCPLNDGAAAALVMDAGRARASVCGRGRGCAGRRSAPSTRRFMGLGPVEATRRLLERERVAVSELDVIELNEAFAAQVLPVCEQLGIDPFGEQLNPSGGAIALGHPFGMTGLRLVGAVVNGLERRGGSLGLATLCVGGGQGQAMLIERVEEGAAP